MIFTSSISAFAAESNVGLTEKPDYLFSQSISLYGIDKPKAEWNLAKEGKYTFSGWCNKDYLYSNYLFYGATKVSINVKNKTSSKITVKLLEKRSGIDWSASTETIPANGELTWPVSGLKSSSYYYLQFSKGSNVSGYIVKK